MYTHTCTHIYVYTIYLHTYIHTYIQYTHIHMYTCTHIRVLNIHTYSTHTCTQAYTHVWRDGSLSKVLLWKHGTWVWIPKYSSRVSCNRVDLWSQHQESKHRYAFGASWPASLAQSGSHRFIKRAYLNKHSTFDSTCTYIYTHTNAPSHMTYIHNWGSHVDTCSHSHGGSQNESRGEVEWREREREKRHRASL